MLEQSDIPFFVQVAVSGCGFEYEYFEQKYLLLLLSESMITQLE